MSQVVLRESPENLMGANTSWWPIRVLVVDDNRDCADSTVMLLRIVGLEAVACYDGDAALAASQQFRPSLCFIDLNMPGMGGDDLARRIRSSPGWQPLLFVAVTAMDDEESRQRTSAAGFGLHLVKPVDPKKLVEVVNTLYRAGGAEQATVL
jgi:CheY-like chemotaxis protein